MQRHSHKTLAALAGMLIAILLAFDSNPGGADMVLLPDSLASKGYTLVACEDGISVYQLEDADTITLAAEGTFSAPPAKVRQVLLDYESHVKMVKQVIESRILERGLNWLLVYQRLQLPVISDRDQTLLVEWGESGENLWLHFRAVTNRGPAERDDAVRICLHSGSWQLKPVPGGTGTYARYQVVIDLGGWLPTWMARSGAKDNIPDLFASIRKRLKEGP